MNHAQVPLGLLKTVTQIRSCCLHVSRKCQLVQMLLSVSSCDSWSHPLKCFGRKRNRSFMHYLMLFYWERCICQRQGIVRNWELVFTVSKTNKSLSSGSLAIEGSLSPPMMRPSFTYYSQQTVREVLLTSFCRWDNQNSQRSSDLTKVIRLIRDWAIAQIWASSIHGLPIVSWILIQ